MGTEKENAKLSDSEVLTTCIERAIENGWKPAHFSTIKASYKHPEDSELTDLLGDWHSISPLDVIFDHSFAKALFGEHKDAQFMPHYVPARGYPGQSVPAEERKKHVEPLNDRMQGLPDYLFACVNCKRDWSKTFNTVCEQYEHGNVGWEPHLLALALAEDRIDYLREWLGEQDVDNHRLTEEEMEITLSEIGRSTTGKAGDAIHGVYSIDEVHLEENK